MNRLVEAGLNGLVKQGFPNRQNRPARAWRGGTDGWSLAAELVERWLIEGSRTDALLEDLPPGLAAPDRARAQALFLGVVRWWSRLDAALAPLMRRPPRKRVQAVLLVAAFELLQGGEAALVVHHAVARAKTLTSAQEAGFVNAVARQLAATLRVEPSDVATRWAHPAWLVARWDRQFGTQVTRQLLEWNQQPAPVHARWRSTDPAPAWLRPAKWPGFFEIGTAPWDEVRRLAAAGALYLQDPSTRLCVDLLAPQPGETILDACAAPGGKSLLIADAMRVGRLMAFDQPAARLDRLKENLAHVPAGVQAALMPGDLRKAGPKYFAAHNLPDRCDAVLLDAPCSNTGVMRHRVDVKWRLQESDFAKHAAQQGALLRAVSRLVRPGGRLVYSTCSIDAEENERVVQRFLHGAGDWKLERQILAYPWTDGHDGAGAFLLRH
jgi:16S rRNA (cytosine967-C5)-methyltransferase